MTSNDFRLDMTMMFAMHDALRRELVHVSWLTWTSDFRRVLASTPGWALFKKALRAHHLAEDEALWPVVRQALAGRPDDLALLVAVEAEHAAIDSVIAGIDDALTDADFGDRRLVELVDALATGLAGHLKHEEEAALPLIDEVVSPRQWINFGAVHGQKIGPDTPQIMPWLLDGASVATASTILGRLPGPARLAYRCQWQPAYAMLDRWGAGQHLQASPPFD